MPRESITKEYSLLNFGYLIKLLSAAVNETLSPEPGDGVDFDLVYKSAKLHSVVNTSFYAVEKLKNKPEKELYKKWMNERNMSVHRNMIQAAEYGELTDAFRENKIDFLPVKGFPLCELYPRPDYRYMSDIDILVRKEDLKKADALIKNMGYMPRLVGTVHHDEFVKPPFTTVELHHELMNMDSPLLYSYYADIFDRCRKVDSFEYRMSDEDFYIYTLVHTYKHFSVGGTGIRSVMDIYLMNKKRLPRLNSAYIEGELKKIRLWDFNKMIVSIGEKWFSSGDVDNFSKEELYIISSGTYGTFYNSVKNRKGGKKGAGFLVSRLFPSSNWMKDHYHVLRKCPFLLPVMYVYRIFKGVFVKRDEIKSEIDILKNESQAPTDI